MLTTQSGHENESTSVPCIRTNTYKVVLVLDDLLLHQRLHRLESILNLLPTATYITFILKGIGEILLYSLLVFEFQSFGNLRKETACTCVFQIVECVYCRLLVGKTLARVTSSDVVCGVALPTILKLWQVMQGICIRIRRVLGRAFGFKN